MSLGTLALALALLAAGDGEDAYLRLVDQAVGAGRDGRMVEARTLLDQAVKLAPERPDAWAERGGAWFVEGRYDHAVSDLEQALDLKPDEWTRELLASAYLLAGRTDDALESWNSVGGPVLRHVRVEGVSRESEALVRRELSCTEGGVLRLDDIRSSRLRLRQLQIVDRATLRPVAVGDRVVDLQLAVSERRGFGGSAVGLALESIPPLAFQTLRLEYANIGGAGLNVGGSWRFDERRPELRLGLEMVRPLGLPFHLSATAWQGRQTYQSDGALSELRARGAGLGVRRAFGARTVGRLGVRWVDRSADVNAVRFASGRLVVAELGLDRRLVDGWRVEIDAGFRIQRSATRLGSVADYWRGTATLTTVLHLRAPEEVTIEPSDLSIRLRGGWAGQGIPPDEAFHPGAGEESEYPLRGRARAANGILRTPSASSDLQVVNVEWRPRLIRSSRLSLGGAAFVDMGRIWDRSGRLAGVADVGIGLRIAATAGPLLRVDWGYGLLDGSHAVTFGLQQGF